MSDATIQHNLALLGGNVRAPARYVRVEANCSGPLSKRKQRVKRVRAGRKILHLKHATQNSVAAGEAQGTLGVHALLYKR
jgi:hypothetical protein